MNLKYFFVLLLFSFPFVMNAQISSAKTGPWTTSSTWVGGIIPGANDDVIIAAGHVVSFTTTPAECNNLTIMGSNATLNFGTDSLTKYVTINGNVLINSGGRFMVTARSVASQTKPYIDHFLTIYGNLTNQGTLDLRGGSNGTGGGPGTASGVNITFAGSSNSTISLTRTTYGSSAEEFNGVTINKTGGAKVILASGNLFMSNNNSIGPVNLTFVSGMIETGNNIWVCLSTASACIFGANANCYVSGALGRGMGAGGGSEKKFFIGDANGYLPILVRSTTGGTATGHYVYTRIVNGNANTGSSTLSGVDSVSSVRYFQVGYSKGGVAGTADQMSLSQFTPSYDNNDNVVQGTTGLMIATSMDNRATWTYAGPSNHVVDLLNPPTEIQSNTLNPVLVAKADSLLFVTLAFGTSTALVPDLSNVSYGSSPMMTFDMWKAPSATPTPLVVYIHGGGMSSGSKADISQSLITALLAKGISVMSINYRLTPEVIIPQHYMDAARAIQYARYHAAELNINPWKIGAGGSSAGACISFWLAFHDDLADPLNDDPVLRETTRLNAVCCWSGQTTMDRRTALSWIGPKVLEFSYFTTGAVFGLTPGTLETPEAYALYEMASPVTHLDASDAPAWMYYSNVDTPSTSSEAIHHINFGRNLKRMMDSLAIPNTLLDPTYAGSVTGSAADFYALHFLSTTYPVEMNGFEAIVEGNNVNLHWITASETNNSGWEIERSQKVNNNNVWIKIGYVNGHGNMNTSYEYTYTDKSLASGRYSYRLKQIDNDGSFKYSFETEADVNQPSQFALEQNYPNPFNPTTSINYSIDKAGQVSLKIYDLLGNLVSTLTNEVKMPGNYKVDFNSAQLSSGVYFYQLKSGERTLTRKMMFMK